MVTGRPKDGEYAPYYGRYVSLVGEDDIVGVLGRQVDEVRALLGSVPRDRETHRYADGKWSVREVAGHLADAERVFGYRAFCIGRGEQAQLPSFDENAYVAQSVYHRTPLAELIEELALLRQANLIALRRLAETDWARTGTASGKAITARALAYVMAGHVRHHLAILRERYRLA